MRSLSRDRGCSVRLEYGINETDRWQELIYREKRTFSNVLFDKAENKPPRRKKKSVSLNGPDGDRYAVL